MLTVDGPCYTQVLETQDLLLDLCIMKAITPKVKRHAPPIAAYKYESFAKENPKNVATFSKMFGLIAESVVLELSVSFANISVVSE